MSSFNTAAVAGVSLHFFPGAAPRLIMQCAESLGRKLTKRYTKHEYFFSEGIVLLFSPFSVFGRSTPLAFFSLCLLGFYFKQATATENHHLCPLGGIVKHGLQNANRLPKRASCVQFRRSRKFEITFNGGEAFSPILMER